MISAPGVYFLPRLGPGPISTRDCRDRYRSRTLPRCAGHTSLAAPNCHHHCGPDAWDLCLARAARTDLLQTNRNLEASCWRGGDLLPLNWASLFGCRSPARQIIEPAFAKNRYRISPLSAACGLMVGSQRRCIRRIAYPRESKLLAAGIGASGEGGPFV